MYKRSNAEYQVAVHRTVDLKKRHRARLKIAQAPIQKPETPSPLALKALTFPVWLVSKKSKRGEVRSFVAHSLNATVMATRRSSAQPFKILKRLKINGKWQPYSDTLEGGPLHHSVNQAQKFLKERSSAQETEHYFSRPSARAYRMLGYFGISPPQVCSAGVTSALIHAHHFARDFDAAFQDRPWINGLDAREISFKELQNSK